MGAGAERVDAIAESAPAGAERASAVSERKGGSREGGHERGHRRLRFPKRHTLHISCVTYVKI